MLLLQVGNVTEDELYWTRPEDMKSARPFFFLPVSEGASDLLGSLIGAFASSSTLFRTLDPVYYAQLLAMAQALYGVMISALAPTPALRAHLLYLKGLSVQHIHI